MKKFLSLFLVLAVLLMAFAAVSADDFKVGVGLGLPISRRMLQSLGGDVWLDTTYTNGARFIISLPCGG